MPHSYDYRKLRGRIKENLALKQNFRKRLGISEVSVNNKSNNVVDWGQEMEHAISVLDIPESDIHAYFLLT